MSKEDFQSGYLDQLAHNHQQNAIANRPPEELLLMYSGALLNWVGEYVNDESIKWTFQNIPVESLTLSGTGPEWDRIIRGQAEMSPVKLRQLINSDPSVNKVFENATNNGLPILVRKDGDRLKVLDGMNRVVCAIRDGQEEIEGYVGERTGEPKPKIEAHVLYDLIRAYKQRGGNSEDFKGGLRFLIDSYVNTRELLQTRFGEEWVHDEEVSKLISEVLDS